MGLLPMHVFFLNPCVGHLKTTGFLSSAYLPVVDILYTLSKTLYLLILLSVSLEESSKSWEGVRITIAGRSFKNSNFCLKTNFKF